MFRWVNNLPIFLRLFLAFAWATIIPAVILVLLLATYFQSLDSAGKTVQTSNQAITITTTELTHLQKMHALLISLIPDMTVNYPVSNTEQGTISTVLGFAGSFDTDTAMYQQQYELADARSMGDIRAILLRNGPSPLISQQKALLDTVLQREWPQYKAAQDALLSGLSAHLTVDQIAILLRQVDTLYTPLFTDWQQVVTLAEQVGSEVVKTDLSQTNPILLATIAAIFASMLIVFAIGLLLNRTITQRLRYLVGLTKRVMRGETAARANVGGRDEIARVALSMNAMLDNIVQLMQETRLKRDIQQSQLEKLIGDVRGVADGDLRLRVGTVDSSLSVLASSSNYMINELESLVLRIKKVAQEVELATVNIVDQMAQPVKTGNQQIKQVIETTAGVEQMARISSESALHAAKLLVVANSARRSVAEGHQAVRRTIDEISQIQDNVQITARKVQTLSERSEEIKNIVEVISTIAYQTNRLALDSAIQAALAGENGKGFAPIAANIRRLSEQTKDHAKLITRIVRSVHEDMVAATASMQRTEQETLQEVRLIQDVGEALNVIFASAERQAQETAAIHHMATQHLQSSNRIVQIMQHISSTTEHNNDNIEMASQQIQHLSQQVGLVRVSVAAFKVHNEQDVSNPSALFPELMTGNLSHSSGSLASTGSHPSVIRPRSIRPKKSS